jgi:uncharacterized damage-inducible protein DinB
MSDLKLIETYKYFLHDYSLEQLRHIPGQGVWSIGQMYDHLIVVAYEYLDSVESCAKTGGEQKLRKTEFGLTQFSTTLSLNSDSFCSQSLNKLKALSYMILLGG